MRPHGTASSPAAGDVTPAVLAIGRPDFPNVLIDTLRRQAGVGHCMVFALTRAGAAHCLLDAGNIPIGGDLGAAYAGQFHESDPNRDALFEGEGRAPIVLPAFAPRMYGARYRKIFFNEFRHRRQMRDRDLGRGHLLLREFLPHRRPGPLWRCRARAAPGHRACDRRKRRTPLPAQSPLDQNLAALFATRAPLADLTNPRAAGCRRILLGFSSEAISQALGISLHSTLTYRKRAYERLGISSQNELFAIVLRLLAGPRSLN